MVAQWQCTDAFARRGKDCIAKRRGDEWYDFFTNTGDPAVRLNKVKPYIVRKFTHPNGLVIMEVGLLHCTSSYSDRLSQRGTQTPGKHAAYLSLRGLRVNQCVATIVDDVHAFYCDSASGRHGYRNSEPHQRYSARFNGFSIINGDTDTAALWTRRVPVASILDGIDELQPIGLSIILKSIGPRCCDQITTVCDRIAPSGVG